MIGDHVRQRLRTVLEEEREALREGKIGRLEALLTEKQELAGVLAKQPLDLSHPEVASLRSLAQSNARMLEAATRGIQSAMERTAERVRVAGHLDIYDASGQRRSFSADASVPRRA